MKKLMTMLAAVATAFGLFADDAGFRSGTHFNDAVEGVFEGAEGGGSEAVWEFTGFDAGDYVNQNTIGSEAFNVPAIGAPAKFSDTELSKNLAVKTTLGNPIYRYFDNSKTTEKMGEIYADLYTRFTVFEDAPTVDANAKIAIWLKENIDENTQEPTSTNLWITAGKVVNDVTVQENYDCGDVAEYMKNPTGNPDDVNGWVRVTIKSFATIYDGVVVPAFVVFINSRVAVCEGEYWTKDDTKTMENAPAGWYAGKKLFLSAKSGSGTDVIQAIGFDGSGNVDNIAFTTAAPEFTKDLPMYTIGWDANVATLTVGGAPVPGFTAGQSGTAMFLVDDTTVEVVATYATDYCRGAWTLNDDATTESSFKFVGDDNLQVVSAEIGVNVTIGGQTQAFATFAEAADAVNTADAPATLTLATAQTILADEEISFTTDELVTLDLNGQTITYAGTGTAITAANLKVLDLSTTGTTADSGAIVATGSGSAIDATALVIENGKFKGWITGNTGAIGGWYDENPDESYGIVAEGCKAQELPEEAAPYRYEIVQDTSVDFTVTAGAHSTIAKVLVNGDDVTASRPAKLNKGDTYEVTFEADNGYVFAAGETGVRVGTAADAAITVTGPDAALIVATVTDADGAAMGDYATLAAAITAATNGCTVTLQQPATLDKTSIAKSITLDLNTKTINAEIADAGTKYLISVSKDYAVTVKNGQIATTVAKSNTAFSEIFHVYGNVTVENVDIDATGLTGEGYFGEGTAAVFAVMNGELNITGSTSVANVNKGYVLSVGNHAGTNYLSRAVTINTTGALDGDFLFAGGSVTLTAGDITGAKFYYGGARAETDDKPGCTTTVFALSDLTGFNLTTGVGEVPAAPADKAKYERKGQLYATVADAAVAAAGTSDSIVLFADYELTADKEFNNAVAVVAPAQITLGTYKLTAPNGDLADAAFAIPTGKKIKKTENAGSFTYELEDDAKPVPPEDPQPVPTGKTAQQYADELNAKGDAAKDLPAEVKALQPALTDDQVTAYKALFHFVPTSDGQAVELQLTDPAETVSNNVATATKEIDVAKIAGGTETAIGFTGIPGLWYQLNADDTLEGLAPVEEVICGTDTTVTFSKKVAPEAGDTARFFKISASAKPKITNQDPE